MNQKLTSEPVPVADSSVPEYQQPQLSLKSSRRQLRPPLLRPRAGSFWNQTCHLEQLHACVRTSAEAVCAAFDAEETPRWVQFSVPRSPRKENISISSLLGNDAFEGFLSGPRVVVPWKQAAFSLSF